jgi:hypothetical protein
MLLRESKYVYNFIQKKTKSLLVFIKKSCNEKKNDIISEKKI